MKEAERELRFRRLMWSTALLPIILAMGASLLLARIVGTLLDRSRWVDHTDQVIGQARRCMETALNMQSALLASGRENKGNLVTRYSQSSKDTEANFDQLRQLVSDNPAQVQRLNSIRASFENWRALADKAVRGPPEATTPLANETLLESHFDPFARGLEGFVQVEERLREQRDRALVQVDRNIRRLRVAILLIVGSLLSGVLWWQLESIARLFRASEASAHDRAEILETTLASVGDAVLATDTKGTITLLNRVAERLTGWSSSEAQGKRLEEVFCIFDEHSREPARIPLANALEESRILTLPAQTVLRSRDGRELGIAATAAPIRQRSGSLLGLVLAFRDITAERQSQSLQARLAAIVKYSDDAIIGKDLDGIITAWNEGAQRMFGFSAEEALGKPFIMVFPPERQQEEPAILEAVRRGESVWTTTKRYA